MKLAKTFLMDSETEKTVYIDTDLTSVNFGKLLFIKDNHIIEISFKDCNFSYDTFWDIKEKLSDKFTKSEALVISDEFAKTMRTIDISFVCKIGKQIGMNFDLLKRLYELSTCKKVFW
mgnify:FL=1|jgi:hypothetical protein